MSKIRKSAKDKPCSLRLRGCEPVGTTVLAHIRTKGTGMGRKPVDTMAVYACRSCHDIIDGRSGSGIMEKEVLERIIAGMAETHEQLIEEKHLMLY